MLNSFLDSSDFCHVLITFANSLDLDQDRKNVSPDLNPNLFDTLIKLILKKKSADDNKTGCKELIAPYNQYPTQLGN